MDPDVATTSLQNLCQNRVRTDPTDSDSEHKTLTAFHPTFPFSLSNLFLFSVKVSFLIVYTSNIQ